MNLKNPSSPLIEYDTVSTIEKIGGFSVHLYSIRDLDKALDEICKRYETNSPEEEEELLNLCPYFGVIWPSARALATFMSERKKLFNKKRGIEVGCGLALPAILASKMGAQIQATDFHPDVGDWVKKNADLNNARVDYVRWDWTDETTNPAIAIRSYDFVLASDVLYESRHPKDLAKALERLVSPTGSIYLSDPGRAYLKQALEALQNLGFDRADFEYEVEESSSLPEHRLEKKRKVQVFEFRRV